jgi:hypothetical protein
MDTAACRGVGSMTVENLLDYTALIAALVGFLVGFFQLLRNRKISKDRWLELAKLAPAACPTIAYVAVVFILNEGMESASPDFFRATAEIIPVLLLALIIEAGALRIEGRGRIDIVANCVTAGYLIAGLTFSLYNLGEDSTRHADVVWASMAAGVAGLLVAAILGRQPKATWGPSSKRADSP